MTLRLAVAGIRHFHILDLICKCRQRNDIEIVAMGEEDPAARELLASRADVHITHTELSRMLDEVDCDIVAIGDCYAHRGRLAIEALSRGCHVISDKPLVTSLEQWSQIAHLASDQRLVLGCQLGNPYLPTFVRLRNLIRQERLGQIHQIIFGGQHPLNYGIRPDWYFQPGKHGGTINDIAIHAAQLIPWLSGQTYSHVIAARTWNAFATKVPHFHDSAQMMLRLSNGAGVIGDVSYAMPNSHGYTLEQYWRFTVFGSEGMAETSAKTNHVILALDGSEHTERWPGLSVDGDGYLESFLQQIHDPSKPVSLSTADVLEASRVALLMQKAADEQIRDLDMQPPDTAKAASPTSAMSSNR